MDFLSKIDDHFLNVAVPITMLVLIVSVTYSLRNIFRIWNAGDPKTVETKKDDSGQTADKKAFDDDVIEDFSASVLPDSGAGGEPARDPKQYCEHIQSEVKKARQRATEKKLTENLTAEDIEREREVKRKQIEDIFKLMEQHGDKFGNSTQDDLQQQMRLYL